MLALTPAERRGALILALLLALGAARDLWRSAHPELRILGDAKHSPGPAPVPLTDSFATAPAPAAPGEGTVTGGEALRLDLNRASAQELDALPGIGPVLAARIVEHRLRYGPFRHAEELRAVRGIGPRLFERLRTHISVGSAPPNP